MRYTFPAIGFTAKKSGICPTCGKRATRSKRFEQTLNPFNKDKDDCIKTEGQIHIENKIAAEKWEKESVYHARCF